MDKSKEFAYLLYIFFGFLAIILTLANPVWTLLFKIIVTLVFALMIRIFIIQFFDWSYVVNQSALLGSQGVKYGPCTINWINRTAKTINVRLDGVGREIILGLKTSPHRLALLGRWTVYTDPGSDLQIYRDNTEPYERWYYILKKA